jgi:hypothetical protein
MDNQALICRCGCDLAAAAATVAAAAATTALFETLWDLEAGCEPCVAGETMLLQQQ